MGILVELDGVLSALSTPLMHKLGVMLETEIASVFAGVLPSGHTPQAVARRSTTPDLRTLAKNASTSSPLRFSRFSSGLGLSGLSGSHPMSPLSGQGLKRHESSGLLPPVSLSLPSLTRYNTAPMVPQVGPLVTGLQDRLRGMLAAREHSTLFNRHEDLHSVRVEVLIAQGGFGSVYQGWWQGLCCAIKVVPQRPDPCESVREAVELAVMSTISHPNILGVQQFWTDVMVAVSPVVVTQPNGVLKQVGANGLLTFESGVAKDREAMAVLRSSSAPTCLTFSPEHTPTATRCLVIVLELCDRGSLEDAISQGMFQFNAPGRTPRINMLAALTSLLEIAMALRYMHSLQLVHCDLKPGNVLLKSNLSDVRQFTTRLCDFGLSKLRLEASDWTESALRNTFTGTVTHSPPEMLRGDPCPGFGYDIYAFGIVMWEIISTSAVYSHLDAQQVAQQVVYNDLRPQFPRNINPKYARLAAKCWAASASDRPTMDQVVLSVSAQLMELRDQMALGAPMGPSTGPVFT